MKLLMDNNNTHYLTSSSSRILTLSMTMSVTVLVIALASCDTAYAFGFGFRTGRSSLTSPSSSSLTTSSSLDRSSKFGPILSTSSPSQLLTLTLTVPLPLPLPSSPSLRQSQSPPPPHVLLASPNNNMNTNTNTIIDIETNDEVKDPNTLISAQDNRTQQLTFTALCGGVFLGSIAFVNLYNTLEMILPSFVFAPFYNILPYVLSSAFIAAGIAHFALEDTFTAFVPPKGSWGGLWQIPSPGSDQLGLTYEQYHSFWSGIAEILVGISLVIATTAGLAPTTFALPFLDGGDGGSTAAYFASAATIPAALMYLLTAAVTPANIYMYTHNPVVPRIPALPYPWGHIGRGVLQCALLAVFYKLAIHSIIIVQ